MAETNLSHPHGHSKRVRIQDRAFTIGEITAINGYRANRTVLKQRFTEGGYHVQETPHFLLCTRSEAPTTVLVHWFAPQEIDADIGTVFMQELKPFGLLAHPEGFGQVFGAVVCSLFPTDAQRALRLYATNTLLRYQHALMHATDQFLPSDSTIYAFAAVYRRVFQLLVGERFLDAGCSFGMLPLLIAEQVPFLTQVLGIDIQTESFPIMRALAEERQLSQVQFVQADLLAEDVCSLGRFDTVTALHVLEHFTEPEMYQVLANLLRLTSQRLLLAVPYEQDVPEAAYSHKQLFTRDKLEAVGQWCLQQPGEFGRMTYEECAGGLLLIERSSSRR